MTRFVHMTVLGLTALLAGCGGVADTLGFGRNPPDEFAVVDRPPLALPPDFDLRPPMPGAPRPQEVSTTRRAEATLFGGATQDADATRSDAEKALLESAGAAHASSDIRATVDREAAQKIVSSRRFVDDLLWWRDNRPPAATVDASAESERLKAARDKGEPLNKGPTPVIERQKTGWLGL